MSKTSNRGSVRFVASVWLVTSGALLATTASAFGTADCQATASMGFRNVGEHNFMLTTTVHSEECSSYDCMIRVNWSAQVNLGARNNGKMSVFPSDTPYDDILGNLVELNHQRILTTNSKWTQALRDSYGVLQYFEDITDIRVTSVECKKLSDAARDSSDSAPQGSNAADAEAQRMERERRELGAALRKSAAAAPDDGANNQPH